MKRYNKAIINVILLTITITLIFIFLSHTRAESLYSTRYNYFQPHPSSYYSPIFPLPSTFTLEQCVARQDFIVSIKPGSCTPTVVRSDLLEEQDVPVFCQLTGIKINPLINVPEIKTITFKGTKPKEIAAIGFHPTRAALRTSTPSLVGSSLFNNLGYLVVVLRRQLAENRTPDWIEANLTAIITYDAEKAFGIGNVEFLLPVLDEKEWKRNYEEYSFWQGKGYIRNLEIGKDEIGDYARLGIYLDSSRLLTSITLHKGQISSDIFLPGFYCAAGMKVNLHNIIYPKTKIKLRVDNDELWLSEGQKLLNGECWVGKIIPNIIGGGSVSIHCKDSGPYILEISQPKVEIIVEESKKELYRDEFKIGERIVDTHRDKIYLAYIGNTARASNINLRKRNEKFIVLIKPKVTLKQQLDDSFFEKFAVTIKGMIEGTSQYEWKNFWRNIVKWIVSFGRVTNYKEIMKSIDGLYQGKRPLELQLKKLFGKKLDILVIPYGEGRNFPDTPYFFTFESIGAISEARYDNTELGELLEDYFEKTISTYKEIAENYGNEKELERYGIEKGISYGAKALWHASELAEKLRKYETQRELLTMLIRDYKDSSLAKLAKDKLASTLEYDFSKSSAFLFTSDNTHFISLQEIKEPSKEEKSVTLTVDGKTSDYEEGAFIHSENESYGIVLKKVYDNYVEFIYERGDKRRTVNIKEGESRIIVLSEDKSIDVFVNKINLKKEAVVSILPLVTRAETEANFTFRIGIEKRAIKLSPEKTRELISELEESIAQWQEIVDNLGNLVKAWKGTCFAGSTFFLVKNFFVNLGGKAKARKEVINRWKTWCGDKVGIDKKYKTFHACFLDKNNEIEKDIQQYIEAKKLSEQLVISAKEKATIESRWLFREETLDTEEYVYSIKKEYERGKFKDYEQIRIAPTIKFSEEELNERQDKLLDLYSDRKFWSSAGEVLSIEDIISQTRADEEFFIEKPKVITKYIENLPKLYRENIIVGKDVEDIFFDFEIAKRCSNKNYGFSEVFCSEYMKNIYSKLSAFDTLLEEPIFDDNLFGGKLPNLYITTVKKEERNINTLVISEDEIKNSGIVSVNMVDAGGVYEKRNVQDVFKPGTRLVKWNNYILELGEESNGVAFIKRVFRIEYGTENKVELSEVPARNKEFKDIIKEFGQFKFIISGGKCSTPIKKDNWKVKYFENEPYKGLVAVVPIDINEGWYVGVPIYNKIGKFSKDDALRVYDESGMPRRFYICNVGSNGRIEFFGSPHGDDECCVQYFEEIGLSGVALPGKTQIETQAILRKAISALRSAAQQYGQKHVRIPEIGELSADIQPIAAQAECEDFMPASDCHALFNLCDPVLCPSSRCNFGGKYYVSNVIQSGVIGSIMLCLPNYRENILVPVCLTGIHAGLDNFVMIQKAFRDCLEESLKTGRNVGICDEIRSIYLCEFFWKQAAPLMKYGISWIFRQATGKTRGGGEYLNFQESWNNLQKSVDYFTNYYGVNAFRAFQVRATSEVGSEVCRSWISTRYPSSADMFDKLLEPESPTQFYAYFTENILTSTTIPPQSHYKVYFRIYAGRDEGVYYQVYLKRQPATELVSIPTIMQVPNAIGYIPRGRQVDKSIDFIAPSGYKELCVRINGQEKCGFTQVTTGFALDELKNHYIKEQATAEVSSEEECISGKPSFKPILLRLNVQSGIEESLKPTIYKRGIIRICASENPGIATEPLRWKAIGYCDKAKKIKCWLDTNSVKDVIKDMQLLNLTLEDAKHKIPYLDMEELWSEEETISRLANASKELKEVLDMLGDIDLSKSKEEIDKEIKSITENLIEEFHTIIKKSLFNSYKVQALFGIADIYEKITRSSYLEIRGIKFEIGEIIEPKESFGINRRIKVIERLEGDYYIAEDENKNRYFWDPIERVWKKIEKESREENKLKYYFKDGESIEIWEPLEEEEVIEKNLDVSDTIEIELQQNEISEILFKGKSFFLKLENFTDKDITLAIKKEDGTRIYSFILFEKNKKFDIDGNNKPDISLRARKRDNSVLITIHRLYKCEDCNRWACTFNQCHSIGNCYIKNGFKWNRWKQASCLSCYSINSCEDLSDDEYKCEDISCTKVAGLICKYNKKDKKCESVTSNEKKEEKLRIEKVVIDPGHGGKGGEKEFFGACGPTGACEKDITLKIAKKLKQKLEEEGIEAILTREDDNTTLSLRDRIEKANLENADLFISIHANSRRFCRIPVFGASGTETYIFCDCYGKSLENGKVDRCGLEKCYKFSKYKDKSEKIARLVNFEITSAINTRNRGVKGADFTVLQYAKMPAILVEMAYICNNKEEKILNSKAGQIKIARAIAKAIKRFS